MASSQCELYPYTPSLPLAAAAIILYSALFGIHTFRMNQARVWTSIFFSLGSLAQLSGYTARIFSNCNRAVYATQSVLLLLGPTLTMFSVNLIQTEFARVLEAEKFCWVPISWQPALYLGLNVVLMVLQLVGGVMTTASSSIQVIKTGTRITVAIYVIQVFFWLYTLAEHTYMTTKLRRQPTEAGNSRVPHWKRWSQLFSLSVSIIAAGRNVMRLTMAGGVAFLIENEWPSYAFDGYQMVIVLSAWAIWYLPGNLRKVGSRVSYTSLAEFQDRPGQASV